MSECGGCGGRQQLKQQKTNRMPKPSVRLIFRGNFGCSANYREIPRTPANAKTGKIEPPANHREIPRSHANAFLSVLRELRVGKYR